LSEGGKRRNDTGKIVMLVTSLLGALTSALRGLCGHEAPVEYFTRAAAKEFGARGISVIAGPRPHGHTILLSGSRG